MPDRFPILQGQTSAFDKRRREHGDYPGSIDHDLVQPHERQAQKNHGQTLERLAERGGLSPAELWCVMNDVGWNTKGRLTEEAALEWLRGLGDKVSWKSL